jgi:tRNA threonylcarbamoyladenosine biosynthesis protein TsaE
VQSHQLPSRDQFTHTLRTDSPESTAELGRQVAGILQGGEVVLLNGPLGAGKTCFVQGLCAGLQVNQEVVSPTFTLVNTYDGKLRVHHLDFYRVEDGDDLTDIGVPDLLDEVWDGGTVLLVEWPGPLAADLGPDQPRVEILVVPGSDSEDRHWHLRGVPTLPEPWIQLVDRWKGESSC